MVVELPKTRDWGRATTEDTAVLPVQEPSFGPRSKSTTEPAFLPMRLVCVTGEDLGRSFRIGTSPSVIGRGDVEFKLSSTDVSRRHAVIKMGDRGCVIEDLRSVNGTYVNGAKVEGARVLQFGDRIQIGNTILVYSHFDELERRMERVQRIEAMAALAGGLAHDFRNALTVIVAGLATFDELLPRDASALRETMADMLLASDSATTLTKRLLNLGGREPMNAFKRIRLSEAIENTIAMARHILGKRVGVLVEVPAGIHVNGDADEIQQVIMNLLVNARDAMPNGGIITLAAEVVQLEQAASLAEHLPSKGTYVTLTVRDTGYGMDETTLARVFEPFFTTKPLGLGTGLGLSVVHAIVKRHGGSVFVDSIPGSGTCFRIHLPLSD